MRLRLDADRTSVTYLCLDCRDRLTLPAGAVGNAGATFLTRHRGCVAETADATDVAAPRPPAHDAALPVASLAG